MPKKEASKSVDEHLEKLHSGKGQSPAPEIEDVEEQKVEKNTETKPKTTTRSFDDAQEQGFHR